MFGSKLVHFYYISVVAEILNILFFISESMSRTVPEGFMTAMMIMNFIYTIFIVGVLLFTRGQYVNSAAMIVVLSIIQNVFFQGDFAALIVISVINIGILIYYNEKMIRFLSEITGG